MTVDRAWQREAVVSQTYLQSFRDSDGDGLLDACEGALGTDPTAESGVFDYWVAVIRNCF